MPSHYSPTPVQVDRATAAVLHVLSVATANLDRMGYRRAHDLEELSAGTCYDDNTNTGP